MGWGGQEHRVLAELKGFQRRGAWVALLAPEESKIFGRAREAGIEVQVLNTRKSSYLFTVLHLKRWMRTNNIQVVNTHSSRDGYLVGAAARLARIPLLIRSRHIDVSYPNPWISRHAFTTFADHVLTTSKKITNHIKSTFRLGENYISTVSTGINLEQFSPEGPKANLFEDGNADQIPVIGMVSVLRSWKGHPIFLKAVRLLLDQGVRARFVIVGEGPQYDNICEMIEQHRLEADVTLLGYREDVPDILRALDVLVIPSTKHEGIPQIGLQALACETPVVGSDAGGIPEIIRPNETGRICLAGKVEPLSEVIMESLNKPEMTYRMSEEGRRFVQRGHGTDHMLDRLEQIYAKHLPMLEDERLESRK